MELKWEGCRGIAII